MGERLMCAVCKTTRWTGSGARVMGKGMSRYKFFRQGCKDGNAGRWIDRVVDVKKVSNTERFVFESLGW